MLRRLASTDWGYEKTTLRATYIAAVRSIAEYAAAAWMPWASSTTIEHIEKSQLFAGRTIAGLIQSTPSEAIRAECLLPPITTRAKQLRVIAVDKALRLAEDNPRALAVQPGPHRRTTKLDWRERALPEWRAIFEESAPEKFPRLLPRG